MYKTILIAVFSLMLGISSKSQNWKIPGAQQQPQWAMPFFFEDGNGNKDTVWIGYDPGAKGGLEGYDSIYIEFQYVDTFKFSAILYPGAYSPHLTQPKDSAWKVDVQSNLIPAVEVGFNNGRMPIKVTWVDTLFYSDSLPYPDISPAPSAKAIVSCSDLNPNYSNCPIEYEVLTLTDSALPQMSYVYRDSLILMGDTSWTPDESIFGLTIQVVPWDDFSYLGIAKKEKSPLKVDIYPNPVKDNLFIRNNNQKKLEAEVVNLSGRVILSTDIAPNTFKSISMINKPPGIYLIRVSNEYQFMNYKIIKL